ncbi:MAG TPA: M1 family metallopeptidase [Steroidobacteraceae bacterium]|nr:M1 family metallopeptidase [Steroidobacteraceae bacterium]
MGALGLLGLAARVQAAAPVREVLPSAVVPAHYDVSLVPDARALTFAGTVGIDVEVKAATADVTLNALGLRFDRVSADGIAGTASYDEKLGRASLHFPAPLVAGPHRLIIAYHGSIGRETLGFFAMDYTTAHGAGRTLATNFEPASARKLLPCWDEPARKATFTLSVEVPVQETAVSNMPVAETTPLSATRKRVTFRETPRMSTYLLFLGIGDFQRIHERVDGVDVGVVVNRGDTPKAAYALDQAGRLLHFYDGYFGIRFPLPKLDLIVAPGEIEGGSMENWGAIFYSQQHLLFDPATSTEADRRLVFLVVSHEMSHQWFGDLVTMAWWDNLWLNEGFARWMQTYAADALHPQWQTGLGAHSIFERGMQADALPSTHPVLQPVLTADQADEAFDNITYDKGAAVITMLNAYIGRDAFREGVRRYMRAHAYGNTVDTDLWSIMQAVAHKPILEVEHDFTRQAGLPLVRVGDTATDLRLTEARFHADPEDARAGQVQHWSIPLAIAVPGQPARPLLLRATAALDLRPPVLVNAGQTAYARVLYPDDAFAALLSQVPALAAVDQIGLMNDALALGLAGYAPASRTLAVAARVPADVDPLVWERIAGILTGLDRRYADHPGQAAFRAFALRLLAPEAARLGLRPGSGEDPNFAVLRTQLIGTRGHFGDAAVVQWARRMQAGGSGSAAERDVALQVVAEHATPSEFDALLARARAADDPLEKARIYRALGGVEDAALAARVITIALGDEMPTGVNADVLADVAADHPDLAWDQAVPHLADPRAALDKHRRWRLAQQIAEFSCDPHRIAQLQEYVARNVPAEAAKPFVGAIATIRQNIRIARDVLPQLDAFVKAQATR